MQLVDGRPVYSATDLVGFLACGHLTALERAALAGLVERPMRPDPELDRIRKRGEQHEQRYLGELLAQGRRVTELRIPDDAWRTDRGAALREAAGATEAAIRDGAEVIYQACFFDGRWLGFADFLVRVKRPTRSLPWSYEVVDTKLARTAKASAVLQICSYVEQLTRVQDAEPETMHVALGGSARETAHLRVADFMAYYRTVRTLFEEAVGSATAPVYPVTSSYPDPVQHCDVCRWSEVCQAQRRRDDDLSLVAGIAARTRRELKDRGVATRRALAALDLPLTPKLERTGRDALLRVREQARIQVEGDAAGRTIFELLAEPRTDTGALDASKGLLALPEPSPNDLFLDLEGDPFALDDGVDYLFGILEPGRPAPDGGPTYHAFWARDETGAVTPEAERRAFEQAIDLIVDRLARDPTLRVYHFAPYEPTALGRLMGRYATREVAVDRLLRGDTLVDLYRAVRQGIRASIESYSIKKLEPLYGFTREVDLRDAGSSIVAFETWLELGGEAGGDDETLERIERYNRDDVVSTWHLRDWLEDRRAELGVRLGEPLPRPGPRSGEETEKLAAWLERVRQVADPLTADVPADGLARTPGQQARWLLAQLLGWHRREQKAEWWRFFHLKEDLTDEERIDEDEPLAGLELVRPDDEEKRIFRYHFPLQEHRLEEGRLAVDPDPDLGGNVTVIAIDDEANEIVLRHPRTRPIHHPTSLVPDMVVRTEAQEESLLRIGAHVVEHGIDGDGAYQAARDLLSRVRPRVGQAEGTPLCIAWETQEDCAHRVVRQMDATYLPIQGPPGSGKTYTGARLILDLVADGRRVGVTANSHKVIGNLLDAVQEAADEQGRVVRLGQKPGEGERPTCSTAAAYRSNEALRGALEDGAVDVAGATAWAWARPEFVRSVDVLVVDEAGQFSLANAVAVSSAADSLILLGDPQQLDQPIQGSHPPGADRSALAHILGDDATMPADRGLFLERTWRLHPSICAFTSELFYEDKLLPERGNERQEVAGTAPLDGTGIRWIPVRHVDNDTDSPEEAELVARLVHHLQATGGTWTDRNGRTRPLTLQDICIVTPYNAHKALIEKALHGARVGTVDKFQGQQAPVSIYSMGTSAPELAPRGMEFLYSLNRLNVATSRAQSLTVLIASPELVRVRCQTPHQMRLANALCRLLEVAAPTGGGEPVESPSISLS